MSTCASCAATWSGMKIEHCPACHHTFTGTTAGDMHRVGEHHIHAGPNRRRCLTDWEMEAKGMVRNARGHWASSARGPENGLPVRPEIDAQGEGGGLVHPEDSRASTQYGSEVE